MAINTKLLQLVQCLSDGEFHSGERLGEVASVSRAAVWKYIQQLQELGVDVVSVRGKGYAIAGGLSLLDGDLIKSFIDVRSHGLLKELQVHAEIESTNKQVLRQGAEASAHALVCLAERQVAGRGRRGRTWVSPFAANIYLSLGWEFSLGATGLEGLSLAVGVAVVRALHKLNISGVQLKWPNDVLVDGKKLGGILLEMAGDASGECAVVTGIGLNVQMPESASPSIDQPWIDLATLGGVAAADGKHLLDRNRVAAALLNELLPLMAEFEKHGFAPYRAEWESLNAHLGESVSLVSPSSTVYGEVLGVADNGGLRLLVDGAERVFIGGELSLRSSSNSPEQ